jgi:Flp pilus assembly protein protease CpaA
MLFLSVLLFVGALTTFTDLTRKKISNLHLGIGAVLGLLVTAHAAVIRHEPVLFHFINGLVAFLIGFLLYRFELWRGGDAKLFALYAFLMPVSGYATYILPPFSNVASLFACSFIAGMAILFPFFVKDFIIHRHAIVNKLMAPDRRQALFRGIVRIVFFSWVLFPFYFLLQISNTAVIFTFMAFFFSERIKEAKKSYIKDFFRETFLLLFIGFMFGFLIRLWLSPHSLSCPALTQYFLRVILSAVFSTCIYTTFSHFKDYHERVPFAPMLLLGCILSYTPFLTWAIHLLHLMRR